jgi:hypothetical protein
MTDTPETGADTGLPEIKYMKTLSPVESLTEREWMARAQEKIALMERIDDCREVLFQNNGGSVPSAGFNGALWSILSTYSTEVDAQIETIVDGFDWGLNREEETIMGARKQ